MKKLLLILILTSICYGSGNVEISEEKLQLLSPDGTTTFTLNRDNTSAYIDWTTGTLYLEGGSIFFDANSKLHWDNSTGTLHAPTVDVNAVDANTLTLINPLEVEYGGTEANSLTDGGILLGSGTLAITALGVASNGQIPIGDGATDPVLATITGSSAITVTNGAGSITLDVNDTGVDHGGLTGLSDDDHPQYWESDGSDDATGDWTLSANSITLTAGTLTAADATLTAGDLTLDAGDITATKSISGDHFLKLSNPITNDNTASNSIISTHGAYDGGKIVFKRTGSYADIAHTGTQIDFYNTASAGGADSLSATIAGGTSIFYQTQVEVQKASSTSTNLKIYNSYGTSTAPVSRLMSRQGSTERLNGQIVFGRVGDYSSDANADSFMDFYTAKDNTDVLALRIDSSQNFNFQDGTITTTGDLVAGAITGTSLTDGTATLSGGNLTDMGNITGVDVDINLGTGTIAATDDLKITAGSGNISFSGANQHRIVITSESGTQDVSVDFMRTGDAYTDWRIENSAGILRYMRSTNDGTSWLGPYGWWASDGLHIAGTILSTTAVIGDGGTTNYTQISSTGAITQHGSATLTLQDGSDLIITANDNAGPFLSATQADTADGVITLSAGAIIGDGQTIGQAAGPLLTFDDSNDYLGLTGAAMGIGTNAPDATGLHVVSSGFPPTVLERTTSNTNTPVGAVVLRIQTDQNMADGFGGGFIFQLEDDAAVANNAAGIYAIRDGGDTEGKLEFRTGGIDTGDITMVIEAAGSVGIGTTSPDTTFQVVGSAGFGDDAGNEVLISTTGVMTFAGDARFWQGIFIDTSRFKEPTSNKATLVNRGIGTAYAFADGQDNEHVHIQVRLPGFWDVSEDLQVILLWDSPTISQDCDWEVRYQFRAVNEAMDSVALDGTVTDLFESSSVSKGLVHSTIAIPTADFAADDKFLRCQIYRDGDDANDNLGAIAYLHGIIVRGVRNKTGGAM